MNKEKITAIKRDNLDRIIEFKTNSDKIYNYEMAKEAINFGIIDNAFIINDKNNLSHIIEKGKSSVKDSFKNLEEF